MPFNALAAAQAADIPILFILRPEWEKESDDNWIEVDNHKEAVNYLSSVICHPSSVFLSVGRQEVGEYAGAPQHRYVIRSIDEISEKTLPNAQYITARPPFGAENELELFKAHKIDYIVSKNSGGKATEGKIIAARKLGVPIIMLRRPERPNAPHVASAQEAMAWLTNLKI
jgi:precorrin-6A/cobalt-precorrin-6A reductase